MNPRPTAEDFMEAIRREPALANLVRRELLTQELLALPETVAKMAKGLDAIREHAEATNKRLDGIDSNIVRMRSTQEDQARAQSNFRGVYAHTEAADDDHRIAGLFANIYNLDHELVETWPIGRRDLNRLANSNIDAIRQLDLKGNNPVASFRRPDIIAAVKRVDDDQEVPPVFCLAVEASYTVQPKDYYRATDNAKIIRMLFDVDAYPVVTGVQLSDRLPQEVRDQIYDVIEEFTEVKDPDAAYWYPLESEDLQPPSP